MPSRRDSRTIELLALAVAAGTVTACVLPSWGANALLHPARRTVSLRPSAPFEEVTFAGMGVTLRGWRHRTSAARRGALVYLHGIADNRNSGTGVARRFAGRGFDVIAYDSRAHGESGGDACTYGYYEKQDLERVLDTVEARPILVMGVSLGATVALQAAAEDDRIAAVVAAEVFSDLSTVARERAPFFLTEGAIQKALALAARRGAFQLNEASAVAAAGRIHVPVLLIHGARDRDTQPDHSRRVFDALQGPKRLILVPDAAHSQSLQGQVWSDVEAWIDGVVGAQPPRAYFGRMWR